MAFKDDSDDLLDYYSVALPPNWVPEKSYPVIR